MSLNDALRDWALANGGTDATFGMKALNLGHTQAEIAADGTDYNSGLLNSALAGGGFLLQEDDSFLLQEDDFKFIL